jgi:hypothetical protein
MRPRTMLLAATAAALLATPSWLHAQVQPSPSDDGARFDAIVSMMRNASPEEVESTARDIFDQAYQGQQAGNYAFAVRGYGAAQRLPNLSQAMRNQLAFWHGYALFQQAIKEQRPQTAASAQATLPKFQEARQLLANAGAYPTTIDVSLGELQENVATYIEIQEAILRQGH